MTDFNNSEPSVDPMLGEVPHYARFRVQARAAQLRRRRTLLKLTFTFATVATLSAALAASFASESGSTKPKIEAITSPNSGSLPVPTTAPSDNKRSGVKAGVGFSAPPSTTPTTTSSGKGLAPTYTTTVGPPSTQAPPPGNISATSPSPAPSSGTNDSTYFINTPSGTTESAYQNVAVNVVLSAPASGTWGTAIVTQGAGTILTIAGQTLGSDGSITVWANTHSSGTATISVPCVGDPALSWTGTVVVGGEPAAPGLGGKNS